MPRSAGVAADIFALGLVLLEASYNADTKSFVLEAHFSF